MADLDLIDFNDDYGLISNYDKFSSKFYTLETLTDYYDWLVGLVRYYVEA